MKADLKGVVSQAAGTFTEPCGSREGGKESIRARVAAGLDITSATAALKCGDCSRRDGPSGCALSAFRFTVPVSL